MTDALTLKIISDCSSSSSSDTQQAAFLKNSAKKISSSTSVMIQHDSLYEKYPSTQLITQELFIYFKIHMLICTFFFHLFPTVKKIIRGSSYNYYNIDYTNSPSHRNSYYILVRTKSIQQKPSNYLQIIRVDYYTLLQIRLNICKI